MWGSALAFSKTQFLPFEPLCSGFAQVSGMLSYCEGHFAAQLQLLTDCFVLLKYSLVHCGICLTQPESKMPSQVKKKNILNHNVHIHV